MRMTTSRRSFLAGLAVAIAAPIQAVRAWARAWRGVIYRIEPATDGPFGADWSNQNGPGVHHDWVTDELSEHV